MTDRALTAAERERLSIAVHTTGSRVTQERFDRLLAEHAALLAVARAAEYTVGDHVAPEDVERLEAALAALPPGLLTAENGDAR